jgi:hypothetical protein
MVLVCWSGPAALRKAEISSAAAANSRRNNFFIGDWTGAVDFCSILFRFVQVFAGRQVGVFLKVFRAQRFGDGVLGVEPFAEVYELATLGAERPEWSGKPVAGFLAGGASGLRLVISFPLQSF